MDFDKLSSQNVGYLQVNDIYVYCLSNFVNGRCPDVFKNYFEFRRNVYNVRQKGQVKIPAARLPFSDEAEIIYIHVLFHFDRKMFQEKGEGLLYFKIFLVNNHDPI